MDVVDNGTSPEPNDTDATNAAAPSVDQASDEVAHEASGDGPVADDQRPVDEPQASDATANAANDERAPADDSDEPGADQPGADEPIGDEQGPMDEQAPVIDPSAGDDVAAAGSDEPARDDAPPPAPAPSAPPPDKKWYIVHTYSGHENKAKLTLLERVKTHNLTDYFGEVLVPTETITENVKGIRRVRNQKFFPGYMFVQMALDDRTFHLVKNTPKITGFLGGMKPTPVPPDQIKGVQSNMTEGPRGKAKARVSFEAGEQVRVVDGPFANFSAKVEEVKADKQKLKVSLSMFGRTTSVELDFAQVEKA